MTGFLMNCAVLLLLPLLFSGWIEWFFNGAGKKNAGMILRPYRDFLELFGKGVRPGSDRNFFQEIVSSVVLASALMAGVLTPIVSHHAVLNFEGATVLFFSFLVMEKVAREFGRKKSPDATRKDFLKESAAQLPEFLVFSVLVLSSVIGGQLTFEKLFAFQNASPALSAAAKTVFFITLWLILLREDGSIAFGYEGSDKAVVLFGGGLRQVLLSSLMTGMVFPFWNGWNTAWGAWFYLVLYLLLTAMIGASAGWMRRFLARHKRTGLTNTLLAVSAVLVLCLSFLIPLI